MPVSNLQPPTKKTTQVSALAWLTLVLACTLPSTVLSKPETLDRNAINEEFKWDFSPIYPSWEHWEKGLADMSRKADEFTALQGTLKKGPKSVLKAYQLLDEIGQLQYLVFRYPQLQRDVDLRNQEVSGKFQQVQAAFARFETATSWFTPELLAIPEKTIRKWLKKTPELDPYRFPILETYRQKAHALDEKGEKLLSFASQFKQTPRSIYQELSTSDINFPEITLSNGETIRTSYAGYRKILDTAPIQADRKTAFEGHYGSYITNKNTYASIYNGILQRDWFAAQARKYNSTLEASLSADAVPTDVYKTLIETVKASTEPLKRYHKLRKRVLGLDQYNIYDSSVSLVDTQTTYDYATARNMVIDSVAPLGSKYQSQLREYLNSRAVDIYENEGKRSGAYVAGVYGVGPYMLLNYNNTLDSVFTLAHEAGHAMHTILSYANQPYVTSAYTIFVAEVASTTNERFLLEKMLAESENPEERFLLLQKAIEAIAQTFYTQVSFADYEWQAHQRAEQGQPITADALSQIYREIAHDYLGDAVADNELHQYLWTRIPHFYNSPYYVYKYATCFASSAVLFNAMTTGTEAEQAAAKERYLELLKSGGNDQPMEQLRKAGVDLTQKTTIQAVIDQMDELVSRLEVEAEKILAAR